MDKRDQNFNINIETFSTVALPHLSTILDQNKDVLNRLVQQIVQDVESNRSLFVFGSGHSAILPLEMYHRAGGPSFMIPLIADFLLPTAGPPVVRLLERTPGSANFLLDRAEIRTGEMLWLVSQSGVNAAVVDLALEAKKRQLKTVAFTSVIHSRAVPSRHPSQKKLYEVCDEVVDWGGTVGDASVSLGHAGQVGEDITVGPLSTLSGVFLTHSILTAALAQLEQKGIHCVYTSVNTPQGEARNKELEKKGKLRDPLLR